MKHITEYYNRKQAITAYKKHRKTWSRVASIVLTHKDHAKDPALRLAATMALLAFNVPLDGVYEERRT
jgi:hypothetical protein